MSVKKSHILAVLTALLLSFFTAYLVGARGTAGTSVAVDETLLSEIQALEGSAGMSLARAAVSRAESSRQKIIQDSIDYSLFLIASASESVSLEESMIQASKEEASRQASIAASLAEESRRAAEASAAEESRRAAEASAAEESRRAAEAAAAEASRRAAEAAASEASRRATQAQTQPQTTASPRPTDGSVTVLIGDSRTSGFGIYGCWPAEYVFYNYSAVSTSNGLTEQAAAWSPARAIFFNGIDDLVSYTPSRAAQRYEEYIAHFQALSPGTNIYVCACLPVLNVALEKKPQLGGVAEFNSIMQGICSRRGWHYFDASAGLTAEAYYGDGIHFTPSFTRTWMSNIRAIVGF